jgi:hypothetical protein
LPLLLPLVLQTSFGFTIRFRTALVTFCIGKHSSKALSCPKNKAFGYRTVLISNTILLGLCLVVLGFVDKDTPLVYYILLMVFYGAFTSIQMSAMNTVMLSELDENSASGGNTMLVISQQLSVSFITRLSHLPFLRSVEATCSRNLIRRQQAIMSDSWKAICLDPI